MSALDDVRKIIERELHSVLADAERLRNVLAALDGTSLAADRRPPHPETPARSAHRRAPRGSVRQAVIDALTAGGAMTAGEIAAGAGLKLATVSSILTRMADDGVVRKAARGYEIPPAGAPAAASDLTDDPILERMRAELRAGLRTNPGD